MVAVNFVFAKSAIIAKWPQYNEWPWQVATITISFDHLIASLNVSDVICLLTLIG